MPKDTPIVTDALRTAASKLQDRHWQWIVDTALRRFRDKVKECSTEMVRISRDAEDECWDAVDSTYVIKESYRDRMAGVSRDRAEYLLIVEFLTELEKAMAEASARRFAEDMAYYFRNEKKEG